VPRSMLLDRDALDPRRERLCPAAHGGADRREERRPLRDPLLSRRWRPSAAASSWTTRRTSTSAARRRALAALADHARAARAGSGCCRSVAEFRALTLPDRAAKLAARSWGMEAEALTGGAGRSMLAQRPARPSRCPGAMLRPRRPWTALRSAAVSTLLEGYHRQNPLHAGITRGGAAAEAVPQSTDQTVADALLGELCREGRAAARRASAYALADFEVRLTKRQAALREKLVRSSTARRAIEPGSDGRDAGRVRRPTRRRTPSRCWRA
jgi:hypothetical protein